MELEVNQRRSFISRIHDFTLTDGGHTAPKGRSLCRDRVLERMRRTVTY